LVAPVLHPEETSAREMVRREPTLQAGLPTAPGLILARCSHDRKGEGSDVDDTT